MENKNEKEGLKLDVKPAEFRGIVSTLYDTAEGYAKNFGKLFQSVSSEYAGGVLKPINGAPGSIPRFEFIVYFKCMKESDVVGIKAVRQSSEKSSESHVFTTLNRLNATKNPTKYELTDEMKEILTPFMFFDRRDNAGKPVINWQQQATEVCSRIPGNGYTGMYSTVSYIMVRLDANMVVTKYYGEKNEKGHPVDYMMTLRNKLYRPVNNVEEGWVIALEQLDTIEMNKLLVKERITPGIDGIYMVTPDK